MHISKARNQKHISNAHKKAHKNAHNRQPN
jgi:hypothetical protein